MVALSITERNLEPSFNLKTRLSFLILFFYPNKMMKQGLSIVTEIFSYSVIMNGVGILKSNGILFC